MWSIINPQTRFVIATDISKRREIKDAKKIFETGKERVESNPSYIITDALNAYQFLPSERNLTQEGLHT